MSYLMLLSSNERIISDIPSSVSMFGCIATASAMKRKSLLCISPSWCIFLIRRSESLMNIETYFDIGFSQSDTIFHIACIGVFTVVTTGCSGTGVLFLCTFGMQ